MSTNIVKAAVTLAGLGLTALLSGCGVSPIGCPIAGSRVDMVFDSIDTPSMATIIEDEPGSCRSGEPATAMRHYQPDGGTQVAELATALTDALVRGGWTDVTPAGAVGSAQPSFSTTTDARRYVAAIDDSFGGVWIYLAAE